MAQKQPKVRIVTPVGTAAYAYINKADTEGQYATNKFKLTVVLDGDTDMSAIKTKIVDFVLAVYPEADPEEIKLPFQNKPDHKVEEFRDKILFAATSKHKPLAVDTKRQKLPKGVTVFSGDEVRAVGTLYAYKKTEKVREGKKMVDVIVYGASLQLSTVQLVRKNAGGGGGLDMLDDLDGDDLYEIPDEDELDDINDDDVPF
jgi:hypothetical protein